MAENRLKLSEINSNVVGSPTKTLVLFPWVICFLGALYYCYEYFLRICPSIMTQELMQIYNLTATEIGVFSAYYYHAYVPMQILVGLLMDRYGPRKLLTLACFLCALGTFLFAGNYSLAIAKLGRFIVGFGSAFAFVGALKLATIWLPPNRFAFVSGIILCLGMLGAMAGDILLRSLVDTLGWQVTIYAAAFSGVMLAMVLWSILRDSHPQEKMVYTTSLNFQGLLGGLFKAIKNPQIWMNGLVGLLLYLSLSAFAELWGISYLEQAHGLPKTEAATANSLVFLGWAIGAPLWGLVSDCLKKRSTPMLVGAILALISISTLLYAPNLSVNQIYFLLLSFGLMSSVQILIFAVCRESVSMRMTATALALTNTFVMIGGNFFQPIVGKLLDLKWSGTMVDGVRIYSLEAYQFALSVLPVGVIISIIILLFLKETAAEIKE